MGFRTDKKELKNKDSEPDKSRHRKKNLKATGYRTDMNNLINRDS